MSSKLTHNKALRESIEESNNRVRLLRLHQGQDGLPLGFASPRLDENKRDLNCAFDAQFIKQEKVKSSGARGAIETSVERKGQSLMPRRKLLAMGRQKSMMQEVEPVIPDKKLSKYYTQIAAVAQLWRARKRRQMQDRIHFEKNLKNYAQKQHMSTRAYNIVKNRYEKEVPGFQLFPGEKENAETIGICYTQDAHGQRVRIENPSMYVPQKKKVNVDGNAASINWAKISLEQLKLDRRMKAKTVQMQKASYQFQNCQTEKMEQLGWNLDLYNEERVSKFRERYESLNLNSPYSAQENAALSKIQLQYFDTVRSCKFMLLVAKVASMIEAWGQLPGRSTSLEEFKILTHLQTLLSRNIVLSEPLLKVMLQRLGPSDPINSSANVEVLWAFVKH